MKPVSRLHRRAIFTLLMLAVLSGTSVCSESQEAQKLTLKHAVELALVHSPAAAQAAADEQKALDSFRETRSNYIPQLTVGSGLGATWGYPLSLEGSAPSLVNVTAQSALFNPALREGIRASRREYQATQYASRDRRSQIVQDTVVAYLELGKWERILAHIRPQHQDALKMQQLAEQRVQAEIDRPQMRTQAKLAVARANLHVLQAEGSIQALRGILSQLTGIPSEAIQIDPDSVPSFPDLPNDPDLVTKAADASPMVLFAQQHALAQGFRARAEHRALWPSVDFATQYAALATYNNWQQYFPRAFQRNNASIGVVIRFPFLNYTQHAHAEAADADARRATAELQSTRNQVSQEVLKIQNSTRQLAAAKEVSELEFELSKSSFDEVEVRMNFGGATVHDEANARTDMSEKYNQLQDSEFELVRARLALLRATGGLESWVGLHK